MTRLEALRERIRTANDAYWRDAHPVISDLEYDKLMRELKKISPYDDLLIKIGHEDDIGSKVQHLKPMLSLDKAYSWDEVISWAKKVARGGNEKFIVSCKYDGMSVDLTDDRMITRGDGYVGCDITALARHCTLITTVEKDEESGEFSDNEYPLVPILDHDTELDSRQWCVGELLVTNHRFTELKQRYPEIFKDYKTPRNLAAGFVMSKPGSAIYDLVEDGCPVYIATIVDHKSYGIRVTLDELLDNEIDFVKELRDFRGYPSDGICFFLADKKYFEELGYTAHHPRGAIAWKFVDEQAQSIVRKIEWQVGEQHVSPVVVFDTIPINGVLVQRASAHCAEWLKDHNICVGSKVTIERKGGVIPKVIAVENDDPKAKAVIPTECPECGTKLISDGKFLTCPNNDCIGRCVNKVVRGLEVLGLKGVGPALASRVVHEFFIRDIIDWCEEVGSRADMVIQTLRTKGFTDHEITTITSVSEVMMVGATMIDLIRAVCIPKCGIEFATTLIKIYRTKEEIISAIKHPVELDDAKRLTKSDAFENFVNWMSENKDRFISYVDMFKLKADAIKPNATAKGTICFTGTGDQPRDILKQQAITKGYNVTDNASKCTILVAEDPNGSSVKLKKARAKGIRIINYKEFSSI